MRSIGLFPIVALSCFVTLSATTEGEAFAIAFEKSVEVTAGGYGRVHPIGGGRFALVYSRGGAMYFRTSVDDCRTWSEESVVVGASAADGAFPANAELLRLKSGRLLYPFNWRPKDGRVNLHPYSIALVTSDDDGAGWSAPQTLYSATNTADGVNRGCYEPFVEEKDGRVRIYFADESPYVGKRLGKEKKNVRVMLARRLEWDDAGWPHL